MSVEIDTYDGAPAEIRQGNRVMAFSIASDGDVEIDVDLDVADTALSFWVNMADWAKIVEHIDRERLRLRGIREAQVSS